MKRSKINAVIKDMEKLIKDHGFQLPPFCKWTPEDWNEKGHESVSYTHLTLPTN